MTDKLREAAQAALEWLRDKRLDTWMYMEDSQFFEDRDKQAEALEAALAEPEQEYICKCGLRVVPHQCKTGKEF